MRDLVRHRKPLNFAWHWKFTITYVVLATTFIILIAAGNHG